VGASAWPAFPPRDSRGRQARKAILFRAAGAARQWCESSNTMSDSPQLQGNTGEEAVPPLDPARMPAHIGIIMDGNGRWASRHGRAHIEGHDAGATSVKEVIKGCRELKIEALSLYAFSTENWRRDKQEVDALFELLSKYMHQEIQELHENGVRVLYQGRMEGLPPRAAADVRRCLEITKDNRALTVNVALNYGGRTELVDAARQLARDAAAGLIDPGNISEEDFAQRLYIPEYSELDLLIRTSGEMRVSNFMLWQISYAEIHVTPVLWPDFRREHLKAAIADFQSRKRRYGGRP